MKKTLSIAVTALLLALPTTGNAQNEEFDSDGKTPLSCTSIMVGKKASTDGSVITSHTCDSWYRTWMKMVPAKDHKAGTKTAIYEGRMHTQSAEDSTKMYKKGEIPQVSHTFRFLDTAYPCLN